MKDKLFERVRNIAAAQFFDRVKLINDIGYEIVKVRQDGMIIETEPVNYDAKPDAQGVKRRFNITVAECEPRVT